MTRLEKYSYVSEQAHEEVEFLLEYMDNLERKVEELESDKYFLQEEIRVLEREIVGLKENWGYED